MNEKSKYLINYNLKVQNDRKEEIETISRKRRGERKNVVCITNYLFKTFRGLDIF